MSYASLRGVGVEGTEEKSSTIWEISKDGNSRFSITRKDSLLRVAVLPYLLLA